MKLLLSLVFAGFAFASAASAQTVVERADLMDVFEEASLSGTFVLFDVTLDQMQVVNRDRADERFIPASTFKFANSLIALELGAVADENELLPYGGSPQPVSAWEHDMTIGEAFAVSNVPVFQHLARRIGLSRYPQWLTALSYGNAELGHDVEHFWLKGPLRISAVEQARFMADLARMRLPFSERTQRIVHEISMIETRNGAVLHGKKGWTTAPDPDTGWFVGWVACCLSCVRRAARRRSAASDRRAESRAASRFPSQKTACPRCSAAAPTPLFRPGAG